MNQPGPRVWTLVLVIGLLGVATGGIGVAAVPEEPPGPPANYYGTAVDEHGNPAPEGTTIIGVVDGEVEGEVVVEEPGTYGGEDELDPKIAADSAAGDTIQFYVETPAGPAALEGPVDLEPGVHEQNLTFPDNVFAQLSTIDLTVDTDTIAPGDSTAVSVTKVLTDGTTENVTDEATVTSTDPDVAVIDEGIVVADQPGTATIEATYTADNVTVTDSFMMTVEDDPDPSPPSPSPPGSDAELINLTAELSPASVAPDEPAELTVIATYDDGTTDDVTAGATIDSLDPDIATVEDLTVVASDPGTATISASYSDAGTTESTTTELRVEPELVGLEIDISTTELDDDESTTFQVLAEYGNGSTVDVTDTAEIDVDGDAVDVDDGAIIADEEGTAELAAEYSDQDMTLDASVTVEVADDEGTLEATPGFTIPVVVVTLVVVIGYTLRRQ